ncbi:hypothetical protein RchiOBHm_Chr5g0006961 [Rosa chinensis]|uniref:Uncharacterized protein n=1 Tax=Rosa chinensis TaxID=74649 RepID=A0A2P6Q3Q3_ROSCH|nr:hypothetical protein RchiOBHm_Chr5g0006961 [Rosa chinensis]
MLLPLVEHVLNVFQSHFQYSSLASDPPRSLKTITNGANCGPVQDISL